MKKLSFFVLFFMIVFTIASCSNSNLSNNHPQLLSYEEMMITFHDYEVPETDYDNIIAYSVKETFNPLYEVDDYTVEAQFSISDDEFIGLIIKNTNPGTSFWYNRALFVERYKSGKWVQTQYNAGDNAHPEWGMASFEEGVTGNAYAPRRLKITDIDSNVKPGKYRVVSFVGDKIIYAEFELIK